MSNGSGNRPQQQHVLPPEQDIPNEDPPPYTPTAEPGTTTVEANVMPYHNAGPAVPNQAAQHRPPPQPPRPQQQHQASPPQPPRPQQYNSPPPPQQPPRPGPDSKRPNAGSYGANYAGAGPSGSSASSSYRPGYGAGPAPGPSSAGYGYGAPPRPQPPFQYPRNYFCNKCHNTSIKLKNGLPCQDCYSRFARQNANVRFTPGGGGAPFPFGSLSSFIPGSWTTTTTYTTVNNMPPRVVRPGDPAIGGILCGHCRGRGKVDDFLAEYTCPTCKGLGRLL